MGNALEELYADRPQELAAVAPQLARHFQEASDTAKPVQYLGQAGQRATQLSADQEALVHFTRALQLLESLPDTAERVQTELALQLGLAVALVLTRGWGVPEMARVVARAQALYELSGETPQRFGTLWFASNYHMMKGDHPRAAKLVWQYCNLAERSEDEGLIVAAYYGATSMSFFTGEFAGAVAFGKRSCTSSRESYCWLWLGRRFSLRLRMKWSASIGGLSRWRDGSRLGRVSCGRR